MINAESIVELPAPKRSRWFWLRIAISTFFALMTVALCELWVRSYTWYENVTYFADRFSIGFSTGRGHFLYAFQWETTPNSYEWRYVSHPVEPGGLMSGKRYFEALYLFGESAYANFWSLRCFMIPYWMLLLMSSIASGIPWFRFYFSFRTLFIATTLLAMVLGFSVWATR